MYFKFEKQNSRTSKGPSSPPCDRRASSKEGVGRVLWSAKQHPCITTTNAIQLPSQEPQEEPPAKRREVCCSRNKVFNFI